MSADVSLAECKKLRPFIKFQGNKTFTASLVFINLQPVGEESIEPCLHPQSHITRKYNYKVNKEAGKYFDLERCIWFSFILS